MITRKVIESLYKKYDKVPPSPDCLDIPLLFESASANHNITIDIDGPVDSLVIGSIEHDSPFLEYWFAIVLHSSIIFLNRKSPKVSVHIRMEPPTIMERMKAIFKK